MNARKTLLALCVAVGSGATLLPAVASAEIYVRIAPPAPRIDVAGQPADTVSAGLGGRRSGKGRKRGTAPAPQPAVPIDLDTATPDAIEALPRIGPALAHRIVANRDSLGPFRSLDGLRRVKGVGPATIALIEPLVTFSRQTRP